MGAKGNPVLVVFGTRPEAIKLAPVIKALREATSVVVCVTGQHRHMLDQTLASLDVRADIDLNVMKEGQSLEDLTASIVQALSPVLAELQPSLVVVQGDTTTAFLAGLAAYYRKIDIAHVEAGLRTGDLTSPWPEEGNRKLISALAALHFAPTDSARNNLLHEGVPESAVFKTGNTVIDTLLQTVQSIDDTAEERADYAARFSDCLSQPMVLITGHRRESFGSGFQSICDAIGQLANSFPANNFVYPVHLNPRVKDIVEAELSQIKNVYLLAPQDYRPFVYLMTRSVLILTDSGGIQEEAPSLGKPVVVMREVTERPEAVDAGTVVLAGTDSDRIFNEVASLLTDEGRYQKMSEAHNPYGDGNASSRIADVIVNRYFGEQ